MTVLLRIGSAEVPRAGSRTFPMALHRASCEPEVWVPLFAALRVVLNVRILRVESGH
jgi:hypothetical protein